MGLSEEFAVLRKRLADLELAIDRANKDRPDGQAAMTGRVFNNGAMPSTVPAFFAVHPCDVGGAEVEGGAITFTESTGVVYFLVIGPDVPEVGDVLFADSCGGRWVAEHQVGEEATTAPTPECPCDPGPATVYAYSSRPDLNNNIFPAGVVFNYQTTPAVYSPLLLPSKIYLSVDEYVDNSGDTFRVLIQCASVSGTPVEYGWHRLYEERASSPGVPVIDLRRYTWAISSTGNTCTPWYQLNGTMFSGGNTTGKVYLSATSGDWAIGEKLLEGNCRTTGFVSIAGAVVTVDGTYSATSGADGNFAMKVPQSASSRPWSAVKSGFTTATGTVAGQATDAAVPQWDFFNVVMSP